MRRFAHLDASWLDRGLLKRRSAYSPIIVFETTDPKRLHQLKDYIATHPEFRDYEYLFAYDHWDGLSRLVRGEDGSLRAEPYRREPAGGSALGRRVAQEALSLGHLKAALKEVDPYLKRWKTLLLLQNVSEVREWETGLQSALRSWAIDEALITHGSTVLIQTADATAVLDQFTRELVVIVPVDPSSEAERRAVINLAAAELEVALDPATVAELVMATAGLNLHQLESILLESYFTRQTFDVATVKTLKADLVKRTGVLEVRDPLWGFADIGGYQVIKDFVRKYIINVLREPERARRFSLPLPKGILLFGPPGTGKSLFANALATEIRLPFINLLTENIYSKWFGESGQRMANAIRMAEKMSPAIVFVDEIDRFGRRTVGFGDSAGEESRRVFSQFLEWLGKPDREAIIVGTTNVPEHLDEAFLRTGRFDYKIPFLYPGEEARLDILLVHLGLKPGSRKPRAPLLLEDDALVAFLREEIVPRTHNFSGAELEELVVRAKRFAFDAGAEGIAADHLLAAARSFRIDHERREMMLRQYLEQARRFTDDQIFLDQLRREVGSLSG